MALIAKITVCIKVHMLRYGMMASKGHSVSIPQRFAIATKLPQLPSRVGIIILRRKGSNTKSKYYTVQRKTVENALKCLCFGLPHGGTLSPSPTMKQYNGPNHMHKELKGRYFDHFPNHRYCDVMIMEDRLNTLPIEESNILT